MSPAAGPPALTGQQRRDALYDELLPRLRRPSGHPIREMEYPNHEGRVWSMCPSHGDGAKRGHRSLSLDRTHGLQCFAGCEFKDIIDALGVDRHVPREPDSRVVQMRKPSRPEVRPIGEPCKVYEYRDASGALIAEKGRWEAGGSKTFRWRKPGGSWSDGIAPLKGSDMPLWGAELIANAPSDQTVYVVEGEKATEACRARGMLAVTLGGGSSTRDFGKAFEVLRGRDVALWPDNDATGRAFMQHVQAHLRTIARSVRLVVVDVPEKGDAFDYFAGGGSLDAIEAREPAGPVREFLDEDSIRVRLSTPGGVVVITCSELSKSARSLDAEVSVEIVGPPGRDPTSSRLNIQSLSQTTEFRRTLDSLYDKHFEWATVLNRAFMLTREGFLQHDPSIDAAQIEFPETQAFHVNTFLPHMEPTILFGDGSAGKSYLAFACVLNAAQGKPFLGLDTKAGPWLVVDYETGASNFGRRLNRVARGLGLERVPPGLVHYWPARGMPLPDCVDALTRKIRQEGIVGVVIDSAAAACGGKAEDSEIALRYFNALARLGVTSLTIAHVNRSDATRGDTERPFGSTFWHNEARRTWYVSRVTSEESDLVSVGLFCKKVNDGRMPKPLGVSMLFDGLNGPVRFSTEDVRDIPELNSKRSLDNRLWDELGTPKAIFELAPLVEAEADTIRKCLERFPQRFVKVADGGGRGNVARWARRA